MIGHSRREEIRNPRYMEHPSKISQGIVNSMRRWDLTSTGDAAKVVDVRRPRIESVSVSGVLGLGFGVWGVGCGVWGVGCGVWGVGSGVWGLWCGVWVRDFGFEVWGVGCGVWGVGCGVWGVWFGDGGVGCGV